MLDERKAGDNGLHVVTCNLRNKRSTCICLSFPLVFVAWCGYDCISSRDHLFTLNPVTWPSPLSLMQYQLYITEQGLSAHMIEQKYPSPTTHWKCQQQTGLWELGSGLKRGYMAFTFGRNAVPTTYNVSSARTGVNAYTMEQKCRPWNGQ